MPSQVINISNKERDAVVYCLAFTYESINENIEHRRLVLRALHYMNSQTRFPDKHTQLSVAIGRAINEFLFGRKILFDFMRGLDKTFCLSQKECDDLEILSKVYTRWAERELQG